jgi:hypothetical protein
MASDDKKPTKAVETEVELLAYDIRTVSPPVDSANNNPFLKVETTPQMSGETTPILASTNTEEE